MRVTQLDRSHGGADQLFQARHGTTRTALTKTKQRGAVGEHHYVPTF